MSLRLASARGLFQMAAREALRLLGRRFSTGSVRKHKCAAAVFRYEEGGQDSDISEGTAVGSGCARGALLSGYSPCSCSFRKEPSRPHASNSVVSPLMRMLQEAAGAPPGGDLDPAHATHRGPRPPREMASSSAGSMPGGVVGVDLDGLQGHFFESRVDSSGRDI